MRIRPAPKLTMAAAMISSIRFTRGLTSPAARARTGYAFVFRRSLRFAPELPRAVSGLSM